ncbi:MAG: type II toxin-antitoxin system RelE/ParE family toxin [Leptolyngbyaceae cyanobacterium CSU_1_4]|nr:type II toxin-antitoxin system RelE/ParE family toxin [Leptolyngbyaceae cyanobacterium CSU_1_4]
MAKVLTTTQAQRDLVQIWILLAERSGNELADQILDEIAELCKLLSQNPEMGRVRQEFSIPLRSFPVQNRPYVIFYNPVQLGIEVYRVLDGRMDLRRVF